MEFPLLRGLPAEVVRRVLAAGRRRTYSRGEVIFHQGDPADTLHLIAKGRLAIRVTTPLGDTATLAVMGPGECVGELALFVEDAHRTAAAVALEPAETLAIGRVGFEEMRARHPAVSEVLLRILADRVRQLNGLLAEALYVPADVRVRRRLLALADLYRANGPGAEIPLTQDDLAGLAGATRSTVNRILRDEEKRGAVALGRGRIEVLDRDALARRST